MVDALVVLVTGPAFGLLGERWRVERWWMSAALLAGALCLEPLARSAEGQLPAPAVVWKLEVAVALSGPVLRDRRARQASLRPARLTGRAGYSTDPPRSLLCGADVSTRHPAVLVVRYLSAEVRSQRSNDQIVVASRTSGVGTVRIGRYP